MGIRNSSRKSYKMKWSLSEKPYIPDVRESIIEDGVPLWLYPENAALVRQIRKWRLKPSARKKAIELIKTHDKKDIVCTRAEIDGIHSRETNFSDPNWLDDLYEADKEYRKKIKLNKKDFT